MSVNKIIHTLLRKDLLNENRKYFITFNFRGCRLEFKPQMINDGFDLKNILMIILVLRYIIE